jgi:hypothetical protein
MLLGTAVIAALAAVWSIKTMEHPWVLPVVLIGWCFCLWLFGHPTVPRMRGDVSVWPYWLWPVGAGQQYHPAGLAFVASDIEWHDTHFTLGYMT